MSVRCTLFLAAVGTRASFFALFIVVPFPPTPGARTACHRADSAARLAAASFDETARVECGRCVCRSRRARARWLAPSSRSTFRERLHWSASLDGVAIDVMRAIEPTSSAAQRFALLISAAQRNATS